MNQDKKSSGLGDPIKEPKATPAGTAHSTVEEKGNLTSPQKTLLSGHAQDLIRDLPELEARSTETKGAEVQKQAGSLIENYISIEISWSAGSRGKRYPRDIRSSITEGFSALDELKSKHGSEYKSILSKTASSYQSCLGKNTSAETEIYKALETLDLKAIQNLSTSYDLTKTFSDGSTALYTLLLPIQHSPLAWKEVVETYAEELVALRQIENISTARQVANNNIPVSQSSSSSTDNDMDNPLPNYDALNDCIIFLQQLRKKDSNPQLRSFVNVTLEEIKDVLARVVEIPDPSDKLANFLLKLQAHTQRQLQLRKEIISFLLNIGCNIDNSSCVLIAGKEYFGESPLGTAIINGHRELMHFLISKGAKINTPDVIYALTRMETRDIPPPIAQQVLKILLQARLKPERLFFTLGYSYQSHLTAELQHKQKDVDGVLEGDDRYRLYVERTFSWSKALDDQLREHKTKFTCLLALHQSMKNLPLFEKNVIPLIFNVADKMPPHILACFLSPTQTTTVPPLPTVSTGPNLFQQTAAKAIVLQSSFASLELC